MGGFRIAIGARRQILPPAGGEWSWKKWFPSRLFAVRVVSTGPGRLLPNPDNVLGVISLIFWSLLIVVSVKYLLFVMRADNEGEGGIPALMALAAPHRPGRRKPYGWLLPLGIFGAALLYGDGMVTPAISVLSAVEGLQTAAPALAPFVLVITVAILVALFAFQHRGTARVGEVFGPVMLLWFLVIAALGLLAIVRRPGILTAVSPVHAIRYFRADGWRAFRTLGAVFLTVAGAEALYADMGHFGRRPIRLAWLGVAMPALLLLYFGQGVLLPAEPRVKVGQIYIPLVNWLLMAGTVGLVLGFRESGRLAGADLRLPGAQCRRPHRLLQPAAGAGAGGRHPGGGLSAWNPWRAGRRPRGGRRSGGSWRPCWRRRRG